MQIQHLLKLLELERLRLVELLVITQQLEFLSIGKIDLLLDLQLLELELQIHLMDLIWLNLHPHQILVVVL